MEWVADVIEVDLKKEGCNYIVFSGFGHVFPENPGGRGGNPEGEHFLPAAAGSHGRMGIDGGLEKGSHTGHASGGARLASGEEEAAPIRPRSPFGKGLPTEAWG